MYDAIVVGARCAGAASALQLARRGHRVLLVDRSAFPSDLKMSTHMLWQPGMAQLAKWGLDTGVAASGCPVNSMVMDLGEMSLSGRIPGVAGAENAYAPRRIVLDQILVDAAVKAGAELRESVTVEELVDNDGSVGGVTCRTRDGQRLIDRATIVVGADGMHSTVAKLSRAQTYHTRPPLQGTYFGYFADVPLHGIEFYPREWRIVYAWKTNDDLTLVGVGWTIADYPAVRTDIQGNFSRELAAAAPGLAERVAGGERVGRLVGGSVPNYFRRPFGPGWALVGDAGYLKDPSTAQGMTDALVHSEWLAGAIDDGLTGRMPMMLALADYERRRNEAVLPMYEFTCSLATFAPSPDTAALIGSLVGDQERTEQFFGAYAGTVPITDFLPH